MKESKIFIEKWQGFNKKNRREAMLMPEPTDHTKFKLPKEIQELLN